MVTARAGYGARRWAHGRPGRASAERFAALQRHQEALSLRSLFGGEEEGAPTRERRRRCMSCCPRLSDNRELLRAARCLLNQEDALTSDCAQSPTEAKGVRALGLNCTLVTDRDWPRGFFLIARTAAGTDVCTSGDTFRVTAVETQQRVRFSGYARAVSDGQRQNNIYWADLTGAAEPLVGRHTFEVTASLLETQNRSLQAAEARGQLLQLQAGERGSLLKGVRRRLGL